MNNNKSTKKRGRGRPALPKKEVKGRIVPVRLNDEDLKLFSKAAEKSEHQTLSAWIRHTLKKATER